MQMFKLIWQICKFSLHSKKIFQHLNKMFVNTHNIVKLTLLKICFIVTKLTDTPGRI